MENYPNCLLEKRILKQNKRLLQYKLEKPKATSSFPKTKPPAFGAQPF